MANLTHGVTLTHRVQIDSDDNDNGVSIGAIGLTAVRLILAATAIDTVAIHPSLDVPMHETPESAGEYWGDLEGTDIEAHCVEGVQYYLIVLWPGKIRSPEPILCMPPGQ